MNLDKQKMMKQTIEIEVPDGKKAVWKNGTIVFEDIKHKLPKTWEEFCKHNKVNINVPMGHLALMQLRQLRDCYRQGWTPIVDRVSFVITRRVEGDLNVNRFMFSPRFLSFQSEEIAKEFLNNFRDLIEQAGDLI